VEEVRRGLEGGMAERAKQDVESGAVAQSIVDSRGPTSNNRLYQSPHLLSSSVGYIL
jgi:hypothetical protein